MATIATVLFNGVAYGVLLVHHVGRAVGDDGDDELRQPGAGELLDVGRLRSGGRHPATRAAVPGQPAARVRDCRPCVAHRRAPRFSIFLRHRRPDPGAAHDRPGLHVDRDRHLFLGRHLSADQRAVLAHRPAERARTDARALSHLPGRGRRGAGGRADLRAGAHAVRRHGARLRRQRARGARLRAQHRA